MKKVLNVGIGGRSFTIDEDAYHKLDRYLDEFRRKTQMGFLTKEVMEDLEIRIAELFLESLSNRGEVVSIALVDRVIATLGMPDGSSSDLGQDNNSYGNAIPETPVRKLYRDPDNKLVGGVCSGLSLFSGIDLVLIRILFLIALIFGGVGFWIYIIVWFVAPLARTATQKCEMRGLPVTAENLRKFSTSAK